MALVLTTDKMNPPGRTGHVAVIYDDFMIVWGGYKDNPDNTRNTFFSGSDLWIYNTVTESWHVKKCSLVDDAPTGMSGSAAVVIDHFMYLFGGYGYTGDGCTNKLYRLNLYDFVWESLYPTGVPPSPVDKMVGWQHNGLFYVFGGFGHPEGEAAYDFQFVFYYMLPRGWTNQFFVYDPKKNHWHRPVCKGNLPIARAAHAVTVVKDKIYIFGGRHDNLRLNDLHCLDMNEIEWTEIKVKGPIPQGRSWHSLSNLSDHILILYGGFSQSNVALTDCWMFNTKTENWIPLELPFEKPRLWHSACVNSSNEILIYGGCTSNILDPERKPDQANDIIVISIVPKTLYRICMNLVASLKVLRPMWTELPYSLQNSLLLRAENSPTSNLDGS